MTEWETTRLADLIDIQHGYAFKGEYFTDRKTNDVLVTPGNFSIGGGFQLTKPKYYDGPVPEGYVLQPGDVIVTMTDLSKQADTLGYSAFVPASQVRFLHNQRVGKVALKDKGTHLPFIAWLMRTRDYRNAIVGSATGSTVKHTSPGRILAYRFKLPPLNTQIVIADTLSAFDDKIALNRAVNETLEGMAQTIFRDWLVDFGPVRRKMAGITDPQALLGGLILDHASAAQIVRMFPDRLDDDGLPAGWQKAPLSSFVSIVGGGTPKTSIEAYWGGDIPWFSVADTPAGSDIFVFQTEKTITQTGLETSAARLVSEGTTIISARGTVGNLALVGRRMTFNQSCYGLTPSTGEYPYLTYLLAASLVSSLKGMAHGSVFATITRKTFDNAMFVRPDASVFDLLERMMAPLFERVAAAVQENRTLAEARDYLLPRLMSGEVCVADAKTVIA
ncbi:restriction endonuclease subunit S [Sphingomonas asaccharolytica]|uniref:restriction endonuclease subunit S n=1 Tax=Sphingomonas asaccharolytica TaxID=40681 RepID=UPI000829CEDA|nr:restriction endonuclease subunit S [Sphingomonas asaccharolytica]